MDNCNIKRDNINSGKVLIGLIGSVVVLAGFYITILINLQNYKTKYCDALHCNDLLHYLGKMNILILLTYFYYHACS